jgi:L-cysteine/cystine lyase
MDAAKEYLGEMLGASVTEIALTQSTTEGLNIVFWGLPWQPGDEVITTNMEHPAGLAPLALIKSRYGILVKYIEVAYGEDYDEDRFLLELEQAITPRTRLLSISHVSFSTGVTFPLKKITDLCHSHGVLVLVDGAQSAGAIPINLHELGVDFFAFTGRKWLCGPEGIGALFVSKKRISEVDPTFISCASIRNRHDLDICSPFFVPAPFAARYQVATSVNKPILMGFQKSLEYLSEQVGMDWITSRISHLARYVRALIGDLPGVELVTPEGKEAGFVHFRVKNRRPDQLCELLHARQFMIRRVPQPHVPAPARISTGFYNTEEELEMFAQALGELVN